MVCLIANAAPVPYALKQEIVEKLGDGFLYEVYGSTELGVDTVLKPEDQLRKPGSCGKPYGGIEIRIVTDDGGDRRAERAGRAVRAHRRSRWTATTAPSEQLTELDGTDVEVGRRRRVRRRRGLRLHLRPQEGHDHLAAASTSIRPRSKPCSTAHPQVLDAAVFGIPDDEWGERVHAIVQAKPGETIDLDELRAFVEPHLAPYKRPRDYELRDVLPRTDSGKLLKRVLRDEYWTGQDRAV